MSWSIDQYNNPCDFDDCSNEIPWSFQEVTHEAKNFEGILITIDGQRFDITGKITRTPSALNFGPFQFTSSPPEGWVSKLIRDIYSENIMSQIYYDSPLLRHLLESKKVPKPPKMPTGLTYARRMEDVK